MKYLRTITIVLCICCVGAFGALYFGGHAHKHSRPTLKAEKKALTVTTEQLAADPTLPLSGLIAKDKQDGDLTDGITATLLSATETDGGMLFSLRYTVFDGDGASDQLTRHMTVTDYTAPEIQPKTPLIYSVTDSADLLENLTATDALDGDCSNRIRGDVGSVPSRAGIYYLPLEVTSSVGVTRFVTLPMIVRETSDPTVTLPLTTSVVYLPVGSAFDAASYLSPKNTADYTVDTGNLDTNAAGTYYIVYTNTAAARRFASSSSVFANSQTILTVVIA